MPTGFYDVMRAQFFSALADNALFVVAVDLMRRNAAPEWQQAALVSVFAIFYVVLAPIAGAIADRLPKWQVMLLANAVKLLGCILLLSPYPLVAYSLVGLGAALYAPAKYGILTELLPTSLLVKANGWLEGLIIASIVFGLALGGFFASADSLVWSRMLEPTMQHVGMSGPTGVAVLCTSAIYLVAAAFNLRVPDTGVSLKPIPALHQLVRDFVRCNALLWRDKLGQVSLATTTLFWGAGGPMRYLVISWGAASLGYGVAEATQLMAFVVLGTAVGVLVAAKWIPIERAVDVSTAGILMGVLTLTMVYVTTLHTAAILLFVIGFLGGFLVVPMNALLQARGYALMTAGRSIAVQNFNEQAGILVFSGLHAALSAAGQSVNVVLAVFGCIVMVAMGCIRQWHRTNSTES